MIGDPTQATAEPRSRRLAVTLCLTAVGVAGATAVMFALLPQSAQPWNLSVIGALALFAAARVGFWPGVGFFVLALVLKDAAIYALRGWEPYPLSYLYFAAYAALGWAFLRRSESPIRIGATTLGASVLFFLVSNFVSWLEQALPYGYSLAGLADCYSAALPFFRGTFAGDIVFSATLFGAHAALVALSDPARSAAIEVEDRE